MMCIHQLHCVHASYLHTSGTASTCMAQYGRHAPDGVAGGLVAPLGPHAQQEEEHVGGAVVEQRLQVHQRAQLLVHARLRAAWLGLGLQRGFRVRRALCAAQSKVMQEAEQPESHEFLDQQRMLVSFAGLGH